MMSFGMSIKGLKEIQARAEKVKKDIRAEVGKTLVGVAHVIMAESKKEVPVDTGRLRQSGTVGKAEWFGSRADQLRVRLGYGTDYALAVHERTDRHHGTGKARFLADPINRWQPKIAGIIADAVARVTKAGR